MLINKSSFKVGDGMKTSFWDDKWLGQRPLKQLFPDIYNLNQQQRACVREVWGNPGWNLSFRRLLNDWEVDRLTEFYNTLEQFRGLSTRVDNAQGIFFCELSI